MHTREFERSQARLQITLGLIQTICTIVAVGETMTHDIGWHTFIGLLGITAIDILNKKIA